jgi:protein TonB
MAQTLALRTHRFHFGKLDLTRLDFTRISAEAGAIAINGVALLLLLAPLSMYVPVQEQREPDVVFLPQARTKPPEHIEEPKKVEVTKRHTVSTPTIVPQKIEMPQIPVVDPLPGDLPADPVQIAKADIGVSDAIRRPLAGAHLEYETAPAPAYPVTAIREALTGTVTLRVLVDVDGRPIDVQIERSSGHRVLDAAARKQVLAKWRFKPAMQDGQRVQAIGLIPVEFNLYQ